MISPRRHAGVLLALLAGGAFAAVAQESADYYERRDADCIDRFNNTKLVPDAPAERYFAQNPLRFRALVGERFVIWRNADAPALPQQSEAGVTADLELPLIGNLMKKSATTQLGIAVGLSGSLYGLHERPTELSGELRLGAMRRRFQPTWSDPGVVFPHCRRVRTDLGLDLVRVRVGTFNEQVSPATPSLRTLTITPLSATLRATYATWGISGTLSLLELRCEPSTLAGVRLSVDYDVLPFATRLEIFANYAQLGTYHVSVMAGFHFEQVWG